VQKAVARVGFDGPTLWINDPRYAELASETGWPSLYDITDDLTVARGPERARRRIKSYESKLFAECDVVVACSVQLAEGRDSARPDIWVIENAVDIDHFTTPQARPLDLPPAPVAVYVGTLHEDRLDVDLLSDVAGALPNVTFALIGPSALGPDTERRLRAHPNVTLLGPRSYANVPAYLQHADVVVIPHVVSPFTESLDPIKAHECLAVNRPTVATKIAGFRDLAPPVVTVRAAEFAETIQSMLTHPFHTEAPQLVGWSDRAVEFASALRQARRETPSSTRDARRLPTRR
jgi:glycosyltransferase involved in cell wall biosynthesis